MFIASFKGTEYGAFNDTAPTTLRCPLCRDTGAFSPVGPDYVATSVIVGLRMCPHFECRAIVFVVWHHHQLVDCYPPQLIDFDANGIPDKLINPFREAVLCHASGCYMAAAIMVRKTLEVLCELQQSKATNLHDRIAGLRDRVVLPEALFDGLNELRILGNDAAHVESKNYDSIGKEEVEVAIEVAKEVLKAVYQHEGLVKRLQGLKRRRP